MKMAVNRMTKKQFIFLIACFIEGSTLYAMYYYHAVGNEAWIPLLCGIVVSLFVVYLYAKLSEEHEYKDLVQINEAVYGKIPGKIISFFYIYTFLISTSITMRQTGQFVAGDLMMETNWIHILLVFVIICAWASNAGIKYFASVSTFTCLFMYGFTILLFLMLLPYMEPKFFLPMGQHSPAKYVSAAGMCTAFPFSELVILMMIIPEFKNQKERKSLWKQFALGILAGSPFILITVLRDTLVLGPLLNTFSYPAYEVIRLINYDMFSHIETLYGALLIFLLFFKSAILFYCITKALAQIFNCQKNIVFTAFTAGLTMISAQQLCDSNIDFIDYLLKFVPYILLAVQVGLPAVTFVISKFKNNAKSKAGEVKCG